METVFEAVKKMNKKEFSEFLFMLYNMGWFDGAKRVDDEEWVYQRMADYPIEKWEKKMQEEN